jgi:lipopolysaccharide export LptBFGC system permease protein LptF
LAWDIIIAIFLAILTIVIAYLGFDLTVRPLGESTRRKRVYQVSFVVCGVLTVVLVYVQAFRASRAQSQADDLLSQISANTKPRDGFLQRETKIVRPGTEVLEAGKQFDLQYNFYDRGGLPVYDARVWIWPQVLESASNPISMC